VHDFASGYISVKMNGASFTEMVRKYIGKNFGYVASIFMVFLSVLVGSVFMVGPASLLNGLAELGKQN
jgi:carbon starvation protein CstA